jgi:chorismate mutase
MSKELSLEALQGEIREVTVDIIRFTGNRLFLARKIGELKRLRGLPIENFAVERRLRRLVVEKCRTHRVSESFGLKLLDLLINESKRIQRELQQ